MREFDVVAIGAGPAGATAAVLLAGWGYKVALLDRAGDPAVALRHSRSRPPGLAESLPPSGCRVFARLGLEEVLASAGPYPTSGNTSWWAERPGRVERFNAGHGVQIYRPALDHALIRHARAHGAVVVTGAAVNDVRVGAGAVEVGWRRGRRAGRARARFVLDGSGRAGVIARRGMRNPPLYRTLALVGFWRWPAPPGLPDGADPSHTLVESYAEGWGWSIPVADGLRGVAVMIDPRGNRQGTVEAVYHRELARMPHLASHVAGARLTGPIRGWDASVYDAWRYADGRLLLIGDAGSAMDPLSSYGVKKALVSGWRAAVVVNTCLGGEAGSEEALDYFDRQERTAFASLLRLARECFEPAAACYRTAYWHVRDEAVPSAGARGTAGAEADQGMGSDLANTDFSSSALADPAELIAVFERLKARSSLTLVPGASVRSVPVLEVVGTRLVPREGLVTQASPQPLRYYGGVNLPGLFRLARGSVRVPDLFEAYNKVGPPVGLPDFLGALSLLIARGALTDQDHTS